MDVIERMPTMSGALWGLENQLCQKNGCKHRRRGQRKTPAKLRRLGERKPQHTRPRQEPWG